MLENIIVTSGGTKEPIDRIRSITNTSTGMITPNEDQTVVFTNTKTNNPTKVITITKRWVDDTPSIRPQPANVTVTVEKTVSYLPVGTTLKSTMTSLAGSANSIKAIKKIDKAESTTVNGPSKILNMYSDAPFAFNEESLKAIEGHDVHYWFKHNGHMYDVLLGKVDFSKYPITFDNNKYMGPLELARQLHGVVKMIK